MNAISPSRTAMVRLRQEELASVRSWYEARQLVRKRGATADARALDWLEARFWLGAAVERAMAFAQPGDAWMSLLSSQTGIGSGTLRESRRFFETFDGDFEAMTSWASQWIRSGSTLSISDMRLLIEENAERQSVVRAVREHNRKTGDDLKPMESGAPALKKTQPTDKKALPVRDDPDYQPAYQGFRRAYRSRGQSQSAQATFRLSDGKRYRIRIEPC